MLDILLFGASWCGPYRKLKTELLKCTKPFNLIDVNIDESPGSAAMYRVKSVPTLIFRREGEEIKRVGGFHSAAKIDKIISELG